MHCASQPTLHTLEMGVAFVGYVENVSSQLQEKEGEEHREEQEGGGGERGSEAGLAAVMRCAGGRRLWHIRKGKRCGRLIARDVGLVYDKNRDAAIRADVASKVLR